MDYQALFDAVWRHLRDQGVACEAVAGEPASDDAVRRAEARMDLRLPEGLRDFYRTVGDGFSLSWRVARKRSLGPHGELTVPSLSWLSDGHLGWRDVALYTPEAAEAYGFPFTDDPARARLTAARMWHWLPVLVEPNGDQVCIDLGDPLCPVVYNRHDWLDGGTGDDGHPLAPDWDAFLADWGRSCFQSPKHAYWPDAFRAEGGIAWDSEEFDPRFRLGGAP